MRTVSQQLDKEFRAADERYQRHRLADMKLIQACEMLIDAVNRDLILTRDEGREPLMAMVALAHEGLDLMAEKRKA